MNFIKKPKRTRPYNFLIFYHFITVARLLINLFHSTVWLSNITLLQEAQNNVHQDIESMISTCMDLISVFMYQNNWQVIIQKYNQKQKLFVVNKWHAHFHVTVKSCTAELAKTASIKTKREKTSAAQVEFLPFLLLFPWSGQSYQLAQCRFQFLFQSESSL